jgi:hypothetical protein
MTKVVVDRQVQSKLHNLCSDLEFRGESGRTLGYYTPVANQGAPLYEWAQREFTDNEIDRARRKPGGLTINELLQGLGDS